MKTLFLPIHNELQEKAFTEPQVFNAHSVQVCPSALQFPTIGQRLGTVQYDSRKPLTGLDGLDSVPIYRLGDGRCSMADTQPNKRKKGFFLTKNA